MLFELNKVTKIYGHSRETQVYAVNNLDFHVREQDFMALIGPSGSGKTTLLSILAGLILPSSGKVKFKGEEIQHFDENKRTLYRLMNMGFVFQDYQLLPALTAYENIELPLQVKKVPKDEIEKKVLWALEEVGLSHLRNRFPKEMSGGQQQRISIARAIANSPVAILADEPTANLDSKTASEIIELFKKLNKELKITFIFSTHDPRLIDHVHHVVQMKDGQIIEILEKK